ncbi:hypothetical protein ABIF96_005747 [Bradyrhizobium ottawaense]
MTDLKKHVEEMIKKAGETTDSGDALKFSQAALNAANAMCSLQTASRPQ